MSSYFIKRKQNPETNDYISLSNLIYSCVPGMSQINSISEEKMKGELEFNTKLKRKKS